MEYNSSQDLTGCERFKQMGLVDSEEVSGNTALLKVHFSPVLHDILKQTETKQEIQKKAKERIEKTINEQQGRISSLQEVIKQCESSDIPEVKKESVSKRKEIKNRITDIKGGISKLKLKIKQLKTEEERLETTAGSISLLGKLSSYVLWALGIYLWVFYVFAIHGAVMREFESATAMIDALSGQSNVLGTTLFSSTPIVDAWQKSGILGILLVVLAPVVFLSIGIFSIIRSQTEEIQSSKWKAFFFLYGNIILAFFIDAIIAKDIVDAVHSVNYESGLESEPLKWSTFLMSTEFYIIMLLGFISYLLWAGILRFYAREKAKLNKNVNLIYQDEETIIEENTKIKYLEDEIDSLLEFEGSEIQSIMSIAKNAKEEIETISNAISIAEHKLDRNETVPVVPRAEFNTNLDCYLKGWCLYIASSLPKKVRDELIEESLKIKETYLDEVLSSGKYVIVESINE
jgi:hypothetical protein